MQAFLLAAGLGTRLRPLTDHLPKALVEVGGRPLLDINLDRLIQAGANRIVVNVHHHADQVTRHLASHHWNADILVSDERQQLLDTGGGLKHAAPWFHDDSPILIHNVDILSRIDLRALVQQHLDTHSLVTLAASRRNTSRYLLFNPDAQLVGWTDRRSGEYRWADTPTDDYTTLAFSGISVIQPHLLRLLPPAPPPYPVIPEYLALANHHPIRCFEHDPADWLDVGKPETLAQAQTWILS